MMNMTEGKPLPILIKFALPILFSSIFQQIYHIINSVIVGRYLGEEALAGIGTTGNLTYTMTAVQIGLAAGVGIIIAQCYGAGNMARMRRAVTGIIWVAALLTVAIILVVVTYHREILMLLDVPENVFEYSATYFRILSLFMGGSVLYNCCDSILRSVGDSKTPLLAICVSSVLNILLVFLFVLYFDMGIAGAAIATVISQHVSGLICLGKLILRRKSFELVDLPKLPDKEMVFLIFKTGIPSAFQMCLVALGNMSVQRLLNSYGSSVMAAYSAGGQINQIAMQICVAFGTALTVFSGQNMGKRYFDRISEALKKVLLILLVCNLVIGTCTLTLGDRIMIMFLGKDASAEVVAIGAQFLGIMGIAYLICGVMQSYMGVIKGAGDVNVCMIAGFTELISRVVFTYVLVARVGVVGFWIAFPVSWSFGCIVPFIRYYTGKWKEKDLTGQSL